MRPRALCAVGMTAVLFAGACVYYNAIYNAQQAYDDAEAHRRAGRDSLAVQRYGDAIEDAADGYRREPDGEWADDALFLLGRARLRLGEVAAAQRALDSALVLTDDEDTRLAILVYRALAAERVGDPFTALALVNEALTGLRSGPALADGHLLRGRLLLASGQTDAGWWDLDRAPAADRNVLVEASLTRFTWALAHNERGRAREAAARLLSSPAAAQRLDSFTVLTRRAAQAWGPAAAAGLLVGADTASWGRTGRARVALLRSELLWAAGDTAEAARTARAAANGIGEGAAEARLWLARERLGRVRELGELEAVRMTLLPASEHHEVAALVEAIGDVIGLASLGLDEPVGLFAGAETARDALGAPRLARGLFLAFADSDLSGPWAPKALLAALAVSAEEGDRAWLRGRLEAHADSPYVLAARGGAAPGFEALEEELAVRLSEIRGR